MASFTVLRPLNVLNTGYSYLSSIITGKAFISGMPVSVSSELTNFCNLRCPECSSGSDLMSRPRGFMDTELFRKVIVELRPYLYTTSLYFQGEPMMHPRFFDFIEISAGIKSVVSTNGHFLSVENSERLAQSGLSKIIVSLDGMNQETYSLYRQGGQFEKVISGIEHLSEAIRSTSSSLKLEIQFLVNRHNESQIDSARALSKKYGAILHLKSMQIIDCGRIGYWLPDNPKFARYKKSDSAYRINSRLGNRCLRLWTNPVITWDGKVVPCCFDKDAEHIMGDLNVTSFRDIWNGKEYEKFRNSVLKNRKSIPICRNCISGLKGVSV